MKWLASHNTRSALSKQTVRNVKTTSSFSSRSGRRGRDMDHWFRQSSYIIIFKMATIIYEEERGSLETRYW